MKNMTNKLWLAVVSLLLCWAWVAQAQGTEIPPDVGNTPFKDWQLNLTTLLLVVRLLGEAFSSIKNGGGLVGLWRALVFGQNLPKAIAEDYKEELKS